MSKLQTIQNQALHHLTRLICLLAFLALASCGGGSPAAPTITVVDAPAITSFVSDATVTNTITNGTNTNLTTAFSGGTAAITNNIDAGTISPTSGSPDSVSPAVTTIYTLTVTNTAGTVLTQDLSITVVAAPTLTSFTTSSSPITASESTNLIPVFANGTGEITNDIDVSTITATTNNAEPVSPSTTTIYTLTVTNAAGASLTQGVTVTVVAAPTITSYISDSASGTELPGTLVNLTPTFTTDGTATIDDGVNPAVSVTSTNPLAVTVNNTTTYTLTVTNSIGFAVSSSIVINVPAITGGPQLRTLSSTSDIVIAFSRTMDDTGAAGTLVLSGDLAADVTGSAYGIFFGGTNNKLTLSTAGWTAGMRKTLTIDAKDTFGNPVTLNLDFDVADGTVFYVNAAIAASVDGLSPGTAMKTINEAITLAGAGAGDFVAVSIGLYKVNDVLADPNPITLKTDVSIRGGYNTSFNDRDIVTNKSEITDTNSTTAGTASTPNHAILAPAGITSTTAVGGFTINGTTNNTTAVFTSGVLINGGADPIIENNIIDGGGDPTNNTSYGIYTDAVDPTVDPSNPIIRNNIITGGTSASSYGVNINDARNGFILRNNTINAGSGATVAHGISNTDATPNIENNIVFSSGANTICYIETDTTEPDFMRNNDFFNCTDIYVDAGAGCTGNGDLDGDSTTCTLAEMNALSSAFINNISVDASFENAGSNDFHLSATTPVSVSAGGLNGIDAGFGYTLDLDGVTRPASPTLWSIGAYEPTP